MKCDTNNYQNYHCHKSCDNDTLETLCCYYYGLHSKSAKYSHYSQWSSWLVIVAWINWSPKARCNHMPLAMAVSLGQSHIVTWGGVFKNWSFGPPLTCAHIGRAKTTEYFGVILLVSFSGAHRFVFDNVNKRSK